MALVLTLKVGEDFYIRDERVVLEDIDGITAFTLRVQSSGKTFNVVDGRSTRLFPDVLVTVGARGQQALARVALEAPRNVPILTGENYRRGKPRG